MRYLVLTDIHANLEALKACLIDAGTRTFDETLVLGDLVGYGGDPNAVVELVQSLKPVAIVRGNHDKVACGLEQAEGFNAVAKSAAKWTLEVLKPEHRDWLCALPAGPIDVDDVVEICHGSPFDEDAYIFDELDAVRALKVSNRPLCLFGHTHYPVTFELSNDSFDSVGSAGAPQMQVQMKNGCKYLINPGSVGQPRDGDPRAAYGILDLERNVIRMRRVAYDIAEAQKRIRAAGLPPALAARLERGQ
jgi:diadenosine tetraphosphatase ApaH/serine/threonine PP2A family protein phosphatase